MGFKVQENMKNNLGKVADKSNVLTAKENFKIEFIDISKIKRNPKNFYKITNIDELAEDIKINGLSHNLVVRPIENGEYELISGERRYTALKSLVDSGEGKFKTVPCKIDNLNDTDAEIILIQSNAQGRELTENEKLKQVERLKALYKEKQSKGEMVGRIREKISADLGLSQTQVGRYESISKNLIPELRQLLEEDKLSVTNASEFSVLNEEQQKELVKVISTKVEMTKAEAVTLKEQLQKIESEKSNAEKELNEKIENIQSQKENEKKELNDKIKMLETEKKAIEEEKDKLENDTNGILTDMENENKTKVDELNKRISELQIASETAIKKLQDIEKKNKEIKNDESEKIRKQLKEDIEKENQAKVESLLSQLQEKKESEKKLKDELQKAKEEQNKSQVEVIKLNAELTVKLRSLTSDLNVVGEKMIKALKNKDMSLSDEVLDEYRNAEITIKWFTDNLSKKLNNYK